MAVHLCVLRRGAWLGRCALRMMQRLGRSRQRSGLQQRRLLLLVRLLMLLVRRLMMQRLEMLRRLGSLRLWQLKRLGRRSSMWSSSMWRVNGGYGHRCVNGGRSSNRSSSSSSSRLIRSTDSTAVGRMGIVQWRNVDGLLDGRRVRRRALEHSHRRQSHFAFVIRRRFIFGHFDLGMR